MFYDNKIQVKTVKLNYSAQCKY